MSHTDHRNLYGIYADVFGGLLRKKSLEEILFKMLPTARNIFFIIDLRRNLDGCFWGSLKARNLWRKSLIKYGLWPEIKIFKENPYENALEYLASGKGFVMDRLRLEI